MYYLELIERFWVFNQKVRPGSTVIGFYLYLLKIAKDSDDYNFKISDVVLSRELGLTRKTVKTTKEKLRNFGLIQFQTKNGTSGSYRLILNYSLERVESEKIIDAEASLYEPSFQKADDKEILLHTDAIIESFSDNSGEINVQTKTHSSNENPDIPEFNEFLAYAQTLSAYKSELDMPVKEKYHSWKNNGWKNRSERPITNWRSSLKSTLPFLKVVAQDDMQLSLKTIPDVKRPNTNFDKTK